MSASPPGTVPGACSRPRAPRAGLAPSSITLQGAYLQHTCQVFHQVRGREERCGFPALCAPRLAFALLEAPRLTCGLTWWQRL